MAITLRQLEIFEKVADSQHVTRAAEQLLLSQSAVSMAIAELERMAGAPLFERRGRRLLLNDRGRLILPESREVLSRVGTIEKLLTDAVGESVGVLQVGASTTIGNYLLPPIVAEFSRRHPRARALLRVGNSQQTEAAVASGELDVGLIEGPSHLPSLTRLPWREDELVVIVGKGHPWGQRGEVSMAELAGAPWIMREKGSGTREVFETAMAAHGVGFDVAMELGHTEAVKKAVEAGLGVGCLSRMAVKRELDHRWLTAVATPLDLRRALTVVLRNSGYRTRLLESYLALLREEG